MSESGEKDTLGDLIKLIMLENAVLIHKLEFKGSVVTSQVRHTNLEGS